ncbi:MAG: diaminopimelate decarboxylase [Candidatus Omnitrophica bacterium]|nr:diaminopimelate decarboxylase [Candidatus Omnitrophota bacterium]
MHHFKYRNNRLYCESVDIETIAEEVGTPFYLYSYKTLIDHYRKIRDAFKGLKPIICFSMKSNSNLSVCRALVKQGAGLDIVSGGELFKAQKIKADPRKIVYASVGKTALEIDKALRAGILFFNVESVPELIMIEKLCARLKKRAKVAIRVNPGVRADTHKYITTGTKENKFGIDENTAASIFRQREKFSHLDIVGIHIHIGSQITQREPFIKALKKASVLIRALRAQGVKIDYLNIGGGLGIIYHKERPQTAKEFAKAVVPLLKKLDVKLILEPGRFISGNSGILVTRVLYVKRSPSKNFMIVDAGMNDLMRPSLYSAYHDILPIRRSRATRRKFDVVGPICESGDFLAKERILSQSDEGDYLAAMGAGAYGFSMSSNYNARPRVAEVMVINGSYYITRNRESYEDLIRGEKIPKVLR